ncbi:hypothetical protein N5E86_15925 [Stutzerimonas stutzeri]|uniref:hypothetical protein n=1 Tax=Stutzerimonas stutzeri TaxID=316 RepID=UPI002447EC90|nr:hypothetical protein [Stutzerimonas stutzeri]MDH1555942.1 hypothetical protein [Stutzerimonas stutzeri]
MSTREEINTQAGPCHDLSREILGTDWYDTESAARRVIEWIVTQPIALWQYQAADGSWWDIRAEWVERAKHEGFPVRPLYAAPRPAEEASGLFLGDKVLNWNRLQMTPPIAIGQEYWVAESVIKLARGES